MHHQSNNLESLSEINQQHEPTRSISKQIVLLGIVVLSRSSAQTIQTGHQGDLRKIC